MFLEQALAISASTVPLGLQVPRTPYLIRDGLSGRLVFLVNLVHLVYLVYFVCLVCLVSLARR